LDRKGADLMKAMIVFSMALIATPVLAQEGLANFSAPQAAKIAAALDAMPPELKTDLAPALKTIGGYTRALSCERSWPARDVSIYMSPDVGGTNTIVVPVVPMHYHDRSQCLDLARYQGWRRMANNAVKF
jgi:hypothetical protein